MLQSSWTTKISNKTVMPEADTMRSLIHGLIKVQATFFDQMMRKEEL